MGVARGRSSGRPTVIRHEFIRKNDRCAFGIERHSSPRYRSILEARDDKDNAHTVCRRARRFCSLNEDWFEEKRHEIRRQTVRANFEIVALRNADVLAAVLPVDS